MKTFAHRLTARLVRLYHHSPTVATLSRALPNQAGTVQVAWVSDPRATPPLLYKEAAWGHAGCEQSLR